MRYLSGTIFSSGGGTKAYEENYGRIFGAKPDDFSAHAESPQAEVIDGAIALHGVCGKCFEVRPVYPNSRGPIALCSLCSEAS